MFQIWKSSSLRSQKISIANISGLHHHSFPIQSNLLFQKILSISWLPQELFRVRYAAIETNCAKHFWFILWLFTTYSWFPISPKLFTTHCWFSLSPRPQCHNSHSVSLLYLQYNSAQLRELKQTNVTNLTNVANNGMSELTHVPRCPLL